MSSAYVRRLTDPLMDDLIATAPAIMLTGLRASGKTTTAVRHVDEVARLDQPGEAVAFRADPDVALAARRKPLLIDEWQFVPGVLGAVKRAVDVDPAPGQFVITGSVRADLDDETWPGTGRIMRLPIWPLVQRELIGRADSPGLLDRIVESGLDILVDPPDAPDLAGYLDLAAAGGLPPAVLNPEPRFRRRWYASYLEQLVTRDAADLDDGRDPLRLRRYVDVLAENTAGLSSDAALYGAGSLNARTAARYERLLQALGLLDVVPAWSNNRLKRLGRRGKRYLTDTGLTMASLRVDAVDVIRTGDLIGRLVDTFVAAQIRPEVAVSDLMPTMYHLREGSGREVDLILDYGRRGVLGIEIKASAAPTLSDAKHLNWLRAQVPEFRAGLVLHTGPRTFRLADDIAAVPIAALWV